MRSASTPNTARRITSSVIARVCSLSLIGSPSGQLRHVAPRRLHDHVLVLAHPLAVEGRQQQLALAHVLGPGQRDHRARPHHRRDRRAPAAEGATSGGAVNTALTASGSLIITSLQPLGQKVSVKVSP